jgi:DNA-binding FrmR family transcriptional regulator
MADTIGPMAADSERTRILNRLRRLEGQVRGLQSMIESGKDCEDVLTQIMAAKSALNQVGLHIIGHSMKRCLIGEEEKTRDELIDDAIAVFLKYSSCVK